MLLAVCSWLTQLPFLYNLKTSAQGWHCPQWLDLPISIINQENGWQSCLSANLMEHFLNWEFLLPNNYRFHQVDKSLANTERGREIVTEHILFRQVYDIVIYLGMDIDKWYVYSGATHRQTSLRYRLKSNLITINFKNLDNVNTWISEFQENNLSVCLTNLE